MKKAVLTFLIVLAVSGCGMQQGASHVISSAVGLNRVITLYSDDGTVIREWSGRYKVGVDGSSARFMHNNKAITISGTFTIEEI